MGITEEAQSLRILEDKVLNAAFWNDLNKIQSYCLSILRYFGKDEISLNINQGGYDSSPLASKNRYNKLSFSIEIPAMPRVFKNENEKRKQIYLRSILLKHELAHIIFTDYTWQFATGNVEFEEFVNSIEDVKIEKKFSKILRGTRKSFFELRKILFKNSKLFIEAGEPTIDRFLFYVQCRMYKLNDFIPTKVVRKYEKLYQKYIGIEYLPEDQYQKMMEKFFEEVKNTFPKKENNFDDEDLEKNEDENEDDLDDDNMTDPDNDSGNAQPQYEITEDEDYDKEIDEENNKKIKTSSKDENEDENGELEEENVDEDAPELNKEIENEESASVDTNEEGSDSKNENEENEDDVDFEDEKDEEKDEDDEELELFNKVLEKPKTIDDLRKAIASRENVTTDDIKNMNFDANVFNGAVEIDLIEFSELKRNCEFKRKYGNPLNLTKREGLVNYRQIVKNNKAIISDVIRFLKLKIQSRTYSRKLNFQQEGNLDQTNLKEIVINKDTPRAFYRKIQKIEPQSRMHFLIDVSGSMTSNQLRMCMINAVIMMEVCKALNIPYGINFFTQNDPGINPNLKKRERENLSLPKLRKIFKNCEQYTTVYHKTSATDPEYPEKEIYNTEILKDIRNLGTVINLNVEIPRGFGVIYYIKKPSMKHEIKYELVLGNIYNQIYKFQSITAGGTPEFQSLIQIYKNNRDFDRNIIFIINDGDFSSHFVDTSIKYNSHKIVVPFQNGKVLKSDVEANINDYISNFEEAVSLVLNNEEIKSSFNKKLVKTMDDEALNNSISIIREGILDIREAFLKNELYDKNDELNVMDVSRFNIELKNIWTKKLNKFIISYNIFYKFSNSLEILVGDMLVKTQEMSFCRNVFSAITDMMYSLNKPSDVIYRKFIKRMREENWRVYGIGIQADKGLEYIGAKHFMVLNDSDEISKHFSKKLREIF